MVNLRRVPHPISGTIYESLGDGLVRVSRDKSDSYGIFKWDGEWVEGDVTQADPALLLYVGGPDLPDDHDVLWQMADAGVHDGSAPVIAPFGSRLGDVTPLVGAYTPDKGMMTPEGMRSSGYIEPEFYLDNDRRPELIPDAFRAVSPMPGGPIRIPTAIYHEKAFHDREVERLWKRTWQMACREDDIPNVGDYFVYRIATLSYLVVRTGENEIRAHQNVCLHRGRLLKDCSGIKAREFRCPFHGWAWNLDGSLKEITTEWDFPGVREDAAQLPPAKIGTWGGYVFINPDPDASPLEDHLGPVMIDFYRKFKLENRFKQAHVEKVVRANWKVIMEAFMEAYHVIATHPHQMLLSGDCANMRYDVFGNWGRAGILSAAGSPQRGMAVPRENALAHYHASADYMREHLRGLVGDEVEQYSDAEINDGGSFNHLFPNICPWGGWARISFRFRPNGDNPNESIMDVMLLVPWPEGKSKPAPAKLRTLGADDPWTMAPELLSLAKILDQDIMNAPSVHAGLKAKQPPYVWLSAYQEGMIRNFHQNYDKLMDIDPDKVIEGVQEL